ncbi:Ethanolamine-phosphate cytidylyltransferase [Eumeta japonica]|uniref:Ethanolamine-phosphate cytidylyltransferase n=1 Tax=Eumeta variegata TaxID=151549 RepID=A0A4C1X4Q5_EUMVA|nr:Ethanolamine-phosphate cytidylyltransferase [Eumeta japonica]
MNGVEERSLDLRSRSHARLRRNATMSHAFSCVQPAFIDLKGVITSKSTLNSGNTMTTDDIVQRIIRHRLEFEERNSKKEKKEKAVIKVMEKRQIKENGDYKPGKDNLINNA